MRKKIGLIVGLSFTLAITPVLALTGFSGETSAAPAEITVDKYDRKQS